MLSNEALTTVFVSLQVKAHRGVDQPFTQPLMEINRKEWLRRRGQGPFSLFSHWDQM